MDGNCVATFALRQVPTQGALARTPPRRINLKNLKQVRQEMARVYREMRNGSIESQDGTRFIYVLSQLGKIIELSELQRGGESKTYEDYLREMHEKIVASSRGHHLPAKAQSSV